MKDIRYRWSDGDTSVRIAKEVELPQFKVLGHVQKAKEVALTTGKSNHCRGFALHPHRKCPRPEHALLATKHRRAEKKKEEKKKQKNKYITGNKKKSLSLPFMLAFPNLHLSSPAAVTLSLAPSNPIVLFFFFFSWMEKKRGAGIEEPCAPVGASVAPAEPALPSGLCVACSEASIGELICPRRFPFRDGKVEGVAGDDTALRRPHLMSCAGSFSPQRVASGPERTLRRLRGPPLAQYCAWSRCVVAFSRLWIASQISAHGGSASAPGQFFGQSIDRRYGTNLAESNFSSLCVEFVFALRELFLSEAAGV